MSVSQESIDKAIATSRGVEDLIKCSGYTDYLVPRIRREMGILARQVMEGDLTPEHRERLRQRYLLLKDVLAWPDKDLKMAKATLKSRSVDGMDR